MEDGFSDLATVEQNAEPFDVAVPGIYRAAGEAYREAQYYQKRAIDQSELDYSNVSEDAVFPTQEESLSLLRSYAAYSSEITLADIDMVQKFIRDLPTMEFYGSMSLAVGRAKLDNWLVDNNVQVDQLPVTYHTVKTIQEVLLTNGITHLPTISGAMQLKGANDGSLCSVTPRFPIPPYRWYCTKSNKSASKAAQEALKLAVKTVFKTTLKWSAAAVGAVGIAVAVAIEAFWDDIFCVIDCDECSGAAGIMAVFDGCTFVGIEAVGPFEFAERFTYWIDADRNGTYEAFRQKNNGDPFLPLGDLPTSSFNVIVDVGCDGLDDEAMFRWSEDNGTRYVYVSPNVDGTPPRPLLNYNQPPLLDGYYYRPNDRLCFSASGASNGWQFERWEAYEGSPSTGNALGSFCTQWNQSTPQPRGVNTIWSHPCGGNITVPGPSFLVCPTGYCD